MTERALVRHDCSQDEESPVDWESAPAPGGLRSMGPAIGWGRPPRSGARYRQTGAGASVSSGLIGITSRNWTFAGSVGARVIDNRRSPPAHRIRHSDSIVLPIERRSEPVASGREDERIARPEQATEDCVVSFQSSSHRGRIGIPQAR